MKRKLFFSILFFIPSLTVASQIGMVKVHSELYQPLNADIQLQGLPKIPMQMLSVSTMTQNRLFMLKESADPGMDTMQLKVMQIAGNPVIKVETKDMIRQPILKLPIHVEWPQGDLIEDIVLLPQLPGQGDEISMPPVMVHPKPARIALNSVGSYGVGARAFWQQSKGIIYNNPLDKNFS